MARDPVYKSFAIKGIEPVSYLLPPRTTWKATCAGGKKGFKKV